MTITPAEPGELEGTVPGDDTQWLVAREGGKIVGTLAACRLPGSIGLIQAPLAQGDSHVEDALILAGLRHLQGVKVVQAFLPSDGAAASRALLRAGFRRVTRLLEMRRDSTAAFTSRSATPSGLTVVPHSCVDVRTFERVLIQAHRESLDCPELDEVRSPEELVAGYVDNTADRSRWIVVCDGEEAVGLALLDDAQLTFLGVVPRHRGRGVGRFLLSHVCQSVPAISLGVDERNSPAVHLYFSRGFEVVGSREVFLFFPP